MHLHPPRTSCATSAVRRAKLFFIECVGARPSENAGAELEENAPGFPGHAELLSKSENESAQKQFPRFYQTAIITRDRNIGGTSRPTAKLRLNQMTPLPRRRGWRGVLV